MTINPQLTATRQAATTLAACTQEQINNILHAVANEAEQCTDELLQANAQDLAQMPQEDPRYDRLRLTPERIQAIAADMRHVATLPSPLGQVLEQRTLPNGLEIKRISVPFGVIGIIYEARPNVTFDVFALCLKAGSACVLKGGRDAECTNTAIAALIHRVLNRMHMPQTLLCLLPSTRQAAAEMLTARSLIDLIIPRGSRSLIDYVRQNATIPVIETGAGVCHTYFDSEADLAMGTAIVCNAKTRRVSVCNALDTLLVHRARLADLPALCAPLSEHNVQIHASQEACQALSGHYPAHLLVPAVPEDYGREWLGYSMSVQVVTDADQAIQHIARYGSGHSECIVTANSATARQFCQAVDAACVYVNAPTSFTDGAQFGLGAEIGISTQKLHARGPMALREITTYKWLIQGNGQTRP